MSFTDQKRRVATDEDCHRKWGLGGDGFRCYLCGHRFQTGDGYRWVYAGAAKYERNGGVYGVTNLLTCDACDGDDVLERWVARNVEFYSDRFWAFR